MFSFLFFHKTIYVLQYFVDNYLFKIYSENMYNNKKRYKKFHNRPGKLSWIGEDRETIYEIISNAIGKAEKKNDKN